MKGSRHGLWDVMRFRIGGVWFWQVYRVKDTSQKDSEQNREYAGPIFNTREEGMRWLTQNLMFLPN